MSTGKHFDLELELGHNSSGEPEIRILRSPFGRPRESLDLGEEQLTEIEEKVRVLEGLLLQEANVASRRRALAEELGMLLYGVLLPGAILPTFEKTRVTLSDTDALRLRLSFSGAKGYVRRLGSLPWELICHPETHQFIAKGQHVSLARYLDLSSRVRPLEARPPLKVLAVLASPDPESSPGHRYEVIDRIPHRRILMDAIGEAKYLQVRFLHRKPDRGAPTLANIRKELREAEIAGSPYYAVHFLCHGGFNLDREGALFLEREDGSEHLVTGRELAGQLTGDIRLVVLASCRTGVIPSPHNGGHPFAGVASALVANGVPAVVAMQFAVSEPAAIAFAEGFYRMIDLNRPIDEAVTEGRLKIEAKGDEGCFEWATPVLFLRAFDGQVLDLQEGVVPTKTVGIFNVLDHGQIHLEHLDFEADLRDYFEKRFIKNKEDWNGAIMDELRRVLHTQLAPQNPFHVELAAPLSIAFAAGYLVPAKARRAISLSQRDEVWTFTGPPPADAKEWLTEAKAAKQVPAKLELDSSSPDIAVVVAASRSALPAVVAFLGRAELKPPSVGHLVLASFDQADQFAIKNGAHARVLAQELIRRVNNLARTLPHPRIHFFLAGPNGLAFALGRECHVLPWIQLYEYDFENHRHGSYEPSITLRPDMIP